MFLAVDIGNTNVVFGAHDGERWVRHWRARTVAEKMPDEYAVLFRAFLRAEGLEAAVFEQVVLSSVVPPLTGALRGMLAAETGVQPLVVSHAIETGLGFAVRNPAEVGADLIANGVAAYQRFGRACIAVDFGTATTFSAISDEADFLGVAIAPGLNLAASALAGQTAQLPQIYLSAPARVVGTDTISALQAGLVGGYVGLVEGLIDRIRAELGESVPVIATGGLSSLIVPLTDRFTARDPWLTLEGLRIIGARNASGGSIET